MIGGSQGLQHHRTRIVAKWILYELTTSKKFKLKAVQWSKQVVRDALHSHLKTALGIAYHTTCVCVHSAITVCHGSPFIYRWIYSHDSSLPSKEENRLLCDPDIPALHHDSHPLPGLLLAQSRVGASQDCLWWVFCVDYSDSFPFYVAAKVNIIHPTKTRHNGGTTGGKFNLCDTLVIILGLMSNITVLWIVHFDVKKMRKYWTFFIVCLLLQPMRHG